MARQRARTQPARRPRVALLLAAVAVALVGCYFTLGAARAGAVEEEAVAKPLAPVAFLGNEASSVVPTVTAAFPRAMKGSAVMSKLFQAVKPYGFTRSNTLYGDSVCSDEINTDRGHLNTLLTRYYGRTFPMGGLAGAPFVGKTGFMAFSHHVPDDGHIIVVFGPHVGFTPQGEPGMFLRKGQAAVSTACGALNAAYSQLTSGANIPADVSDLQMSWLRAKLKPYIPDVERSGKPMINLALATYKVIEDEIMAIVNTDYGPGNLVLLGGIQINMPYPLPGYFAPMHFSIRSSSMAPKDLMPVFAGY